jgi:hypothetical protein
VIAGHPFLQNLRPGHYQLGGDAGPSMVADPAATGNWPVAKRTTRPSVCRYRSPRVINPDR